MRKTRMVHGDGVAAADGSNLSPALELVLNCAHARKEAIERGKSDEQLGQTVVCMGIRI